MLIQLVPIPIQLLLMILSDTDRLPQLIRQAVRFTLSLVTAVCCKAAEGCYNISC